MIILTPGFPSSCHGENRPKVRVNTGVVSFMLKKEEREGGKRKAALHRFSLQNRSVGTAPACLLKPPAANQRRDETVGGQHDPVSSSRACAVGRLPSLMLLSKYCGSRSTWACTSYCLVPWLPRRETNGQQGGVALFL